MAETILKMIPLWLMGSVIPLILVSILQYYICQNKTKYALVIPFVSLIYLMGKFFLYYISGVSVLEKEYELAIYFLVFVSNGLYFVVTFLEYLYFKRQHAQSRNRMPFSR